MWFWLALYFILGFALGAILTFGFMLWCIDLAVDMANDEITKLKGEEW